MSGIASVHPRRMNGSKKSMLRHFMPYRIFCFGAYESFASNTLKQKMLPLGGSIDFFCRREGIRTLDTLLEYTHFPGVRLRPLGHPSKLRAKIGFLSGYKNFNYDNSPRSEVSKTVLNSSCGTSCPNRYIILVIAASVVISSPDITPSFFSMVLVS